MEAEDAVLTVKKSTSKDSLLNEVLGQLNDAVNEITNTIDLVGQPASIITSAVSRVKGTLDNCYKKLRGSVLGAISDWQNLFDLFTPGSSGSGSFTKENFEAIQSKLGEASYEQSMSLSAGFSGRNEVEGVSVKSDNDQRLKKFFNETLLLTAIQRVAETVFASYDDAIEAKKELTARLSESGITSSVGSYLDGVALQLPRLIQHQPYGPSNTLELSQQFYDDPDRAEEIRLRNCIQQPMFVLPDTPLYLLED